MAWMFKKANQTLITSRTSSTANRAQNSSDPTSPWYSAKTFEDFHLDGFLLRGIYNMGFNQPSRIQDTALPILLSDPPRNIIAQSQSGTGKTVAMVLAMLSRVDTSQNYPQILYVAPTVELAVQTGEVAMRMALFHKEISIQYAVRGKQLPIGTRFQEQIIVGSPNKVVDWGFNQRFFDFSKIRVFVLDEADMMIAKQNLHNQTLLILRSLPNDCQMIFFSSTYDEEELQLAQTYLQNPVAIRLRAEETTLNQINHYYVDCGNLHQKYAAVVKIEYLISTFGRAIVFCETKKIANWLFNRMTGEGLPVALVTGEMNATNRNLTLNRFKRGDKRVLISTNILARGIDIKDMKTVVNFDLPIDDNGKVDFRTYIHRVGRAGRFGKPGLAINLVGYRRERNYLLTIASRLGRAIQPLKIWNLQDGCHHNLI